MITKFEQSSGNTIGYKISGTISKDDYAVMVPEAEALVDQEGDINMLLDLSEFHWEEISAWGADMKFGSTYRKKIDKMAIVGDSK
ncbi:MAG: STAS/SEC14 domain-containing protein [Chloroflexota bacterium]|nr:STAS/SEC14 domain-containing protein [Chloroflexota bacterium]